MDEFEVNTKKEMLSKLRAYASTPDNDNIRIKEKIKQVLLKSPELLYSLHNEELESELFDESGNLTPDGEWDRYFGISSSIRPVIVFPDTQTKVKNYLCYKVDTSTDAVMNNPEKYCRITFVIFCEVRDCYDREIGVPRHDLIGGIVSEIFSWSNYFGRQAKIVTDTESITGSNYVTRTIVFEALMPNSVVKTTKGKTRFINNQVKV